MDKNKSIDGLSTRRSKTAATSSATRKTASKPRTKTTPKTSKTTPPKTTKTVTRKATVKATTKTKTAKTTKTTKPTKTAKTPKTTTPIKATPPTLIEETPGSVTEDFLKPVQAFNFDEQSGELKAADPSEITNQPKKGKKMKKPISKKRKIITSILLVIVLLILGGLIWLIIWGNDILARITGGQGTIFDLFSENYVELKTDANGRTNILAFGTSGYNMEGDEGNGIHDGAQLTDSIMVISLDQKNGDVAMLSLPRDLKASPTCTATGKINEVYWCNNMEGNDEKAGATALMDELNTILDIDFQYYAHLNWGSLVSIVDTLGGINVTLDEDISDYGWTGAVFQAGEEYTINGEQALGLARARHGTESGDFSRGASQQKILIGIKDKVLEKSLSVTDMLGLANTLGDNLRTNFSVEELKSFAHLTYDFDFSNIRQISLLEPEQLMTTGNINGISYVIPSEGAGNYSNIQAYIAKMFSSDPRVYEDSSILILNATDQAGLASNEKNELEKEGYNNIFIDDTLNNNYEGDYILYILNDKKPGTKKLLEEKYSTEAKSANDLSSGIPTNYDFILIINKTNEK